MLRQRPADGGAGLARTGAGGAMTGKVAVITGASQGSGGGLVAG